MITFILFSQILLSFKVFPFIVICIYLFSHLLQNLHYVYYATIITFFIPSVTIYINNQTINTFAARTFPIFWQFPIWRIFTL